MEKYEYTFTLLTHISASETSKEVKVALLCVIQ